MKRSTRSAWFSVIAVTVVISLFACGSCGLARKKTALDLRIDSAVGKLTGVADTSQKYLPTIAPSRNDTATPPHPHTSTQPHADTATQQHPDTANQPAKTNRLPVSAYLGYAYPPTIPRGVTRFFNAYVSVRNDAAFIHDTLHAIISDQEGAQANLDTIIIYPRDISFYKSVHIALLDPSGDFHIERVHASDTQYVDPFRGNQWKWSITTETDKKVATLLLKAEGLRSEGISDDLDVRSIPVRITVKPFIARSFFDYLTDNPKVSVPLIVAFLGFIGWLIKYYLEKKKKNGDGK
jgi:hypothetical protein